MNLDETMCGLLCQHPSCWASQRRLDIGVTRVLSQRDPNSSDSRDEMDLPTQSIYNLLGDFGESSLDYTTSSYISRYSFQIPANPKARHISLPARSRTRGSALKFIKTEEVFSKANLSSGSDEPLLRKQFYIWVPNLRKVQEKCERHFSERVTPSLVKDLTESVMPKHVSQDGQNSALKKHPRRRQRPAKFVISKKFESRSSKTSFAAIMQPKSYFASKKTFKSFPQGDGKQAFPNKDLKNDQVQKYEHKLEPHCEHVGQSKTALDSDADPVVDCSLLHKAGFMQKDSQTFSNNFLSEVKHKFPSINDDHRRRELVMSSQQALDHPVKMTLVSLGLPELPTYVQTTKPFSYKKLDINLCLEPVKTNLFKKSPLDNDDSNFGTNAKLCALSTQSVLHDYTINREGELVGYSKSAGLDIHINVPYEGDRLSRSQDSYLPPEKWQLTELALDGECSSAVSKSKSGARSVQRSSSKGQGESGENDQKNETLDINVKADSPAPPPPSPESKLITSSQQHQNSLSRQSSRQVF